MSEAAGVTGRPESITTLRPTTRLPGVAPPGQQLERDRIEPLEQEQDQQNNGRRRSRRAARSAVAAAVKIAVRMTASIR